MYSIRLDVNPLIYEHIMFFLKNLPKNMINIDIEKRKPENKTDNFYTHEDELSNFQELSNISLEKIWNNKEDEVYDRFLK
ncbi:MAG: hypothetical protein IE909_15505 [Campylobacterales bacterium]|nr:hypothetical protein [Campylobacterales bacterium]